MVSEIKTQYKVLMVHDSHHTWQVHLESFIKQKFINNLKIVFSKIDLQVQCISYQKSNDKLIVVVTFVVK